MRTRRPPAQSDQNCGSFNALDPSREDACVRGAPHSHGAPHTDRHCAARETSVNERTVRMRLGIVDWSMKMRPKAPSTWAVFPGEQWFGRNRGPGASDTHSPRDENQPCSDAETRERTWGSKAWPSPHSGAVRSLRRRHGTSHGCSRAAHLLLSPKAREPPHTTHGGSSPADRWERTRGNQQTPQAAGARARLPPDRTRRRRSAEVSLWDRWRTPPSNGAELHEMQGLHRS